MTQQNNNVIYVVNLGAEGKRFTHRRCKVLTRGGGGGGGDGASKFEIEARQKLQNFSTNDVTHQNR